jgi:4-hydroxybenzoate polyprenyltransferase
VLRLLRPRQWTKNLLLFAALLFARKLLDPTAFATACLAFVSFCLASSSVYVVNDLVDVERDRLHPEKRDRPIASGRVGRGAALALAVGLATAALAVAAWISRDFALTAVVYMALSHFYSFVAKNVVILDTLIVAVGFVIRAVAGAIAIQVPYSDWFVLCTLFVALFIALSKRKAELLAGGADSRTRPVLAHYSESALGAFTGTSMAAAVISYSLYVQDILHESAGERRLLIFTVPFVIVAIFRYHLLVEKEGAGEKPEEILLGDRPLQLSMLGFVLVAAAAYYGGG